ncbi:hypothetical protein [Dechloromonas denitrificans]|uniref:hypothetical protein n=1 Tax=Dechloromonas denitrificans TaxID=281362 RepID=UPI001CF8E61C|nr:hypothetical protein [Dechloromonas denitrificans]UCV01735.1 hypothetical protein KI611_11435 [Dechloromonas denitrificans]
MQTLTYTPVPAVCNGPRNINTMKHLINEVGQWARANNLPELDNVMRDAYGLAVTCWTEFDEGLQQLSQAIRQIERGEPKEAIESIRWAMKYMHRWQDRDGAVGNAECVTEEELTGLTLDDGRAVPASFASAKIDHLDDLENLVKGLRLVKSVFGLEAKLIISPKVLDSQALREVWPQLLERLLAPCPGAIESKPFDWKASGILP